MLTVTLFDLWIGEVPIADHHDEAYASHLSVGDTCNPGLACLYSSVGRFGSDYTRIRRKVSLSGFGKHSRLGQQPLPLFV